MSGDCHAPWSMPVLVYSIYLFFFLPFADQQTLIRNDIISSNKNDKRQLFFYDFRENTMQKIVDIFRFCAEQNKKIDMYKVRL